MALFFDIKRYSINDGPGIRITIFFKGCPLSCIWCHNPEGISPRKERLYSSKKCIGCGECVSVCPVQSISLPQDIDNNQCVVCGACAKACPTQAMEISGEEYSIDYLMQEIEKETIFMDSSEGGVTFCGGEPLLYPDVLLDLLSRCGKTGIHRTIDTTLYSSPENIRKIMEQTDLFLVDLKHMDPNKHLNFCGVSNKQILTNIQLIAKTGKEFIIRIPLIEGINADKENIIRSAEFLASLPWNNKLVHLLPYHEIGQSKHKKLGTVYNPEQIPMKTPSQLCLQECIQIFDSFGIQATTGG